MMSDYGKYIELLRQMVRIPSQSFEEEGVAGVICSFLESEGIRYERRQGNILALGRHFDPAKPTLALDAHIDTVPAASSYTRDPYDPGNDPETVWGLGSNDDGGSVAAMIAAFSRFYDISLPVNLMLTLTREEERSGPDGARWLYGGLSKATGLSAEAGSSESICPAATGSSESICPAATGLAADPVFPLPKWVIVGEPTGMKAATSEKGLLVLDGEAHGVSGHAARGEGVNALYIALDDIAALRAHRFEKVSPVMGDVHLNVTQIEAGSAHNVIPDLCRFVVDIRPTDVYSNPEILEELQGVCRSELRARNLANRSSATSRDGALYAAVRSLALQEFSSPTTSDWMRISGAGVDAVKMGPGDSARSHRADEYIKVSEITEAIEIYSRFIATLARSI